MPRRKKNSQSTEGPRGNSRLSINSDMLAPISPLSENQERIFKAWEDGKHMFIYGCAGTGKTFTVLYNALKDVLKENPTYKHIYLVRSLVATREIGFLPGDLEDKTSMWQIPYKNMVKYMFEVEAEDEDAADAKLEALYSGLRAQDSIKFWSTSFLRGVTLDDAVIIIDEMQNLNFHELDSIITRVGEGSRIIFCGDGKQSDLTKSSEKGGIHDFMRILERMTDDFELIEMGVDDIVRSGLVRNYLITKDALGLPE